MKQYVHHKEFKVITTQVLDALNELIIKRIDEETGQTADNIHVNLRYSPKTRTIHYLVTKSQHIQLPVMSLILNDVSYDSSRVQNKHQDFYVSVPELSSIGVFKQPIPVVLTYSLNILTRYQNDLDQILTCLFSNFFPYVVISYKHPDFDGEVRCVVEWDGNLPFTVPNDLATTTPYRFDVSTTFKVRAWIYKNSPNNVGIIHKIDTTFTSVSAIYDDFDAMELQESDIATDYWTISARPQLKMVTPYQIYTGSSYPLTISLYGDMFDYTKDLYLSGTSNVFSLSDYNFYNPISGNRILSSVYTGFSALSVESWSINSNNLITLSIPYVLSSGYIDIWASNDAGIGKLTIDSIRLSSNPYPDTLPEASTYAEPQYPWLSGIKVY